MPQFCLSRTPSHLHVHLILDDLEKFPRLWDTASFYLGPNRHVVESDLKRSCTDKLSFHSIEKEEGHHAGVDFIVEEPLSPAWSRLSHASKWVKAGKNHHNDEKFENTKTLGGLKSEATGREVITLDVEVWVFLLQYSCILLKYLLVPSGVTVEELYCGAHQLGHLGGGYIFLGVCFYTGYNKQRDAQPYRAPAPYRHPEILSRILL